MKKYRLSEIKSTQKGKGFYLKISNEIASYLIYYFQSLSLHPNYITFVSLLFGISFSYFLLNEHKFTALLMINLMYLFDNLDGQWARVKKMTSSFGALFDSLVDGWNISIIVVTIGFYLYSQEEKIIYLYLMILFFIFSFLEFAYEKNIVIEKTDNKHDEISLHKSNQNYRSLILWISYFTSYDKWIFFITVGILLETLDWVLIYLVFVRVLNYSVKLFKLYLKYR
jgi:phosphatidylglycerophosphate synthase